MLKTELEAELENTRRHAERLEATVRGLEGILRDVRVWRATNSNDALCVSGRRDHDDALHATLYVVEDVIVGVMVSNDDGIVSATGLVGAEFADVL